MKSSKERKQIYLKAAKLVFKEGCMIGEAISTVSNDYNAYRQRIRYIGSNNYPEINLFKPDSNENFYSKEERINALLFSHEMI